MSSTSHSKSGRLLILIAMLFVVILLMNGFTVLSDNQTGSSDSKLQTSAKLGSQTSEYYYYYNNYKNEAKPNSVTLQGSDVSNSQNSKNAVSVVDNKASSTISPNNTWSEWNANIENSGVYSINLGYYPLAGTGRDIEISVTIDGKQPFEEASHMSVPRIWADQSDSNGVVIKKLDSLGNDIRQVQVEKPQWTSKWLSDSQGMYDEPYLFYLPSGQHTIRISMLRENVAIESIELGSPKSAEGYSQYQQEHSKDSVVKGNTIRLEAEDAFLKNSSLLYASYDHSTMATLPNDVYHIKLNTIGADNWLTPGESITWKANVPQDGMYQISFRARKNQITGMVSYRTLYINGKIPFKEAENIAFPYSSNWYVKTLGDKTPYLVYLKKGDEITLDCSPGKLSGALRNINQSVLELNSIYRQIIVLTGTSPDANRDYGLDTSIPNLLSTFKELKNSISSTSKDIQSINGGTSSQTSTLDEMTKLLTDFINDPYTITQRFGDFQTDVQSMGSLITNFDQQPLELDCLAFVPQGGKVPEANSSFFDSFLFGLNKFVVSFYSNYNGKSSSTASKDSVNVWVMTGRDNFQILSNMINSLFTTKTKIPINLSVVKTSTTAQTGLSTLIPAELSGQGPDVALMVSFDTPVNLAMRGALVNLAQPEFNLNSNFQNQFYPSSWLPYYYNGGTYALPETQNYNMLFYRTDIFNQLGIKVPQSWDDFYNVMHILQSGNLEVGIPEMDYSNPGVSLGVGIFDTFLFQNGGTYFNTKLSETVFNTKTADNAFYKWVELYKVYGLDRAFDFFNRFRTGEMPMGIVPNQTYSQLMMSAPEIRGLWKMAPIPGTLKSDGSIDRSESSTGSACVMLKSAQDKHIEKEAFSFMSWWVSSDTQVRYGQDCVSVLGVGAMYYTANIEAFKHLGWSADEASALTAQWNWIKNVNQIPGSYIITRDLTNAFRSSQDLNSDPTRVLTLYNQDINQEITRKRAQFKLG
jgi:ABC-type glycerol-3-phosphate transport system substrate-binding protein